MVANWYEAKDRVSEAIGLEHDALHVHLGLAIFLAGVVLFRNKRHGPLWALALVAGIQGLNEALDARDWLGWTGTIPWPEIARDSLHTLLWPGILALVWPRGR